MKQAGFVARLIREQRRAKASMSEKEWREHKWMVLGGGGVVAGMWLLVWLGRYDGGIPFFQNLLGFLIDAFSWLLLGVVILFVVMSIVSLVVWLRR